ncbi:hypothetical protein [Endozoicomonas sp. ISHI1]|uniref:hypothetical protein n=1 Tax=Endozoicomonas sp. ISHI1 TaxID=2825882 RepID=UPI0021484C0A|nr:hypothetical protein [Endozoicomonas sp. ISHI1]
MKMEGVYVLGLTGGHYYVGWSSDIARRVEQHSRGEGALWTQQHPPERIIEVRLGRSKQDETRMTRFYMGKFGVDNVRGGPWCSEHLNENPLMISEELYLSYLTGMPQQKQEPVTRQNFDELKALSQPVLLKPVSLPTIDYPVILEYQQILQTPGNEEERHIVTYECDAEECENEFDGELPCVWEYVRKIETVDGSPLQKP